MQVTSKKTITFPKLHWGINKGEKRDLPKDEKTRKTILEHPAISKVGEEKEEDKK